MSKLITVVTGCYNEEGNVDELYRRVKAVFEAMPEYRYEHLFIDNASEDTTVEKIKAIAKHDKNIKLIVNARNFGHIRSPFYALMQAQGDAVISLVADLQDPPEIIPEFLKQWENGFRIVVGVKNKTEESFLIRHVRRLYYKIMTRISEENLIENFTGFGLYDQQVINEMRKMEDVYPYFRGLVSEIGFKVARIQYVQPQRLAGKTKNNFYTLYDLAMLGITSHSKVPIRLVIFCGFILSVISLGLSLLFFILKLIFWKHFTLGLAPILIGMFFFSSIQLFFIGILGEYILSINRQVLKRPLVVEKERVNFDV